MRFSLIRLCPGQSTGRIPQRHLGWLPAPATREAPRPRGSWPLQSPARLEALGYGGLCCPHRSSLLCPPPTSAQRSATSRSTLIGFAATGSSKKGTPWAVVPRCQDGSLLFRDGLCDRSAPNTPTGL